jgi:hypothetical protein
MDLDYQSLQPGGWRVEAWSASGRRPPRPSLVNWWRAARLKEESWAVRGRRHPRTSRNELTRWSGLLREEPAEDLTSALHLVAYRRRCQCAAAGDFPSQATHQFIPSGPGWIKVSVSWRRGNMRKKQNRSGSNGTARFTGFVKNRPVRPVFSGSNSQRSFKRTGPLDALVWSFSGPTAGPVRS